MIFITGDMHGSAERMRSVLRELRGISTTEQKLLLVCGDFGYVMLNDSEEHALLDAVAEEPVTIAFCDGNHENFDYLNRLPVQEWNGGMVHAVRHNVLHLMRGQCYTIEGNTFFVMGGAASTDRAFRLTYQTMYGHKIWWKQELPTEEDYRTARDTLQCYGFAVDYILSHTAPQSVIRRMGYSVEARDYALTKFFDWINDKTSYRHWYFGHFHEDCTVDEQHTCLNLCMIPLGECMREKSG